MWNQGLLTNPSSSTVKERKEAVTSSATRKKEHDPDGPQRIESTEHGSIAVKNKPKAKAKVAHPKKAQDSVTPTKATTKSLGEIKIVSGSNQTYIQQKVESSWRLVVAVSSGQSADHAQLGNMLFCMSQILSPSNEQIVEMRNTDLATP